MRFHGLPTCGVDHHDRLGGDNPTMVGRHLAVAAHVPRLVGTGSGLHPTAGSRHCWRVGSFPHAGVTRGHGQGCGLCGA